MCDVVPPMEKGGARGRAGEWGRGYGQPLLHSKVILGVVEGEVEGEGERKGGRSSSFCPSSHSSQWSTGWLYVGSHNFSQVPSSPLSSTPLLLSHLFLSSRLHGVI